MGKTDRTARLLKVMQLMHQSPRGISPEEIADKCKVNVRTTYRDLKALEYELAFPVWESKGKRGVEEGYFLPPIHFSLPEVMTIFIASRLMARYTQRYEPNMVMTFTKLSAAIKSPILKEHIEKTTEWLKIQLRDERYLHIMATLAKSWVKQQTVQVQYHTLGDDRPSWRYIDPYFIEPAAEGHSSYVIAYCHRAEEVRTFKIERIKNIERTEKTYEIPRDFDVISHLWSSWGIATGGEVEKVRLRFIPEIKMLLEEVVWHPSQKTSIQPDGSVIMTLEVLVNVEFIRWVVGWGEKVEVMEPKKLKREIIDSAKAVLEIYR